MASSSGSSGNSNKVIFRPARPEDINDIVGFSEDLFIGRDVLPYMYMNYISSSSVLHAVAEISGKVVSFVGLLISDNHTTGQFIMGRTKKQYMGKNILHDMMFQLRIQAEKKWPTLNKFRTSSYDPAKARERTDFECVRCRTLLQLCTNIPVTEFIKTMEHKTIRIQNQLQKMYRHNLLQHLKLTPDDNIHYNPEWVLIDSFLFNLHYPENIDLIFSQIIAGGRLCAYMTKTSDDRLESISFSQPVPILTMQAILRINIDYYGRSDEELIKSHIVKQLQNAIQPGNLDHFPNIERVNAQLFLPNEILDDKSMLLNLQKYFAGTLGFEKGGEYVLQQAYASIRIDLYEEENKRRSHNRVKKQMGKL